MRGLTIDNSTYMVRAQDYGYWADENFKQILSRTYIEVLKFPGEIEVTPFTIAEGTKLMGYLSATHGLSNSNPEFRDLPKFIPFDDQFYDEKRLTYFGNTGLHVAKKELDKLSNIRLAKGIKRYLIKDYERNILICLRMYDACREGWFTAFKTELIAFKAPEIYK